LATGVRTLRTRLTGRRCLRVKLKTPVGDWRQNIEDKADRKKMFETS